MKKFAIALTFISMIASTASIYAAAYYTGFEDVVKASYVAGNVSASNIVWTFDSAVSGTLSSDRKEGGTSVRMARNATAPTESRIYTQVITGAFSAVSFKYAKYGTADPTVELAFEVSTDYGSSWTQVGTNFYSTSTALTLFQETFGPYSDMNIRITTLAGGTGSRNNRVNIDTLALIPEPAALLGLFGILLTVTCVIRRMC